MIITELAQKGEMEKKFAVLSCAFGLLVGCAETNYPNSSVGESSVNPIEKNSAEPDVHTADYIVLNMQKLSFDENYFMKKGQNFQIASDSEKSAEQSMTNNSKPQPKETIDYEKSAYITHCYLGKLDGKHVILRTYNTGGSGIFTDVVLCSVEMSPTKKGTLHIDDVLLLGDRALDGIVGGSTDCVGDCPDRPHLGPDGNLYLKMRASISTIASLAGVSDRDVETGPFQSAQDFWNVSECVYNLKTKKLEIVAMDISFGNANGKEPSTTSDVAKILEEIFPSHGKTIRVEKDGMPEFLNKFKSAYLKLARKNGTK